MSCARRTTGVAVAALLAAGLAACAGSDSAPAGSTSSWMDVRAELVRLTVDGMAGEGLDVDRACVAELAGELSDDDARALVEAYPDGDPELSESGRGIGARLLTCADRRDLLEALIGSILATTPVSEDCIRPLLEPLDVGQLAALLAPDPGDDPTGDSDDGELDRVVDQLIDCRPSTD